VSKILKIGIVLLVVLCGVLLAITFIGSPLQNLVAGLSAPRNEPLTEDVELDMDFEGDESDLAAAVKDALAKADGHWAEFAYKIDYIQFQDDGQMAIVWLGAVDPETDEFLGREPELALAELNARGKWQVLLEDDESFRETFKTFQYAEKSIQGDLISEDQVLPKSGKVFGGYYLPWAAELEKRLTWSVAHTSCYPIYYCTHAFDFADGTMFPLVAAKGGTVFHWKDTCANGDTSCTNSITLQDRSTTPWTYQIYLHIAQNSVPANLRKVGTPVMQGQFIANVDDTGYSSGHHVHFMVVTEDTRYMSSGMGSVWGVAEDITFKDVDINWDAATQGGRPRLAYEAETYGGEGRTYYISGNLPAFPPKGGLTEPVTKTILTTPKFTVSGWGEDDIGVTKYEILAKYATDWVTIGEFPTDVTTFTGKVDLCKAKVPDGPIRLALRVWDYEGNPSAISSITKLIKDVECGTAGTDPKVTLTLNDGVLALPQSGFVSADVTEGSTGSDIVSVAFYFHKRNWDANDWVLLGIDSNGSNGWQAYIDTTTFGEGSTYGLMAVATDKAGNQDVDVSFNAVVDHTIPWATVKSVKSPVTTTSVTLKWEGGDDQTGIDYYTLEVSVNNGDYQPVYTFLGRTTTSVSVPVAKSQVLVFRLTAFDMSGNSTTRRVAMYTEGYEFPYGVIFSNFINGEPD